MYISDVRIENYRTFQDVTFHFDSRANYIVGDNNIGKSNFLSFLKTVTHGYGFREADFLDENNPIHKEFKYIMGAGKDRPTNSEFIAKLTQDVRLKYYKQTIAC